MHDGPTRPTVSIVKQGRAVLFFGAIGINFVGQSFSSERRGSAACRGRLQTSAKPTLQQVGAVLLTGTISPHQTSKARRMKL